MSSLRLVSERPERLARVIPLAGRTSRGETLQRAIDRIAEQRRRVLPTLPHPKPPAPTTPSAA